MRFGWCTARPTSPRAVVDQYAGYLTVQTLTQAMDQATPEIVGALRTLLIARAIIARERCRGSRAGIAAARDRGICMGQYLAQPLMGRRSYSHERIRVAVDPLGGQKTGIYLDQRENYLAAARWATVPTAPPRLLHFDRRLCSAPRARLRPVEAVDSSATALAAAKCNAAMNGIANIRWREADVFDLLAGYAQRAESSGRLFSIRRHSRNREALWRARPGDTATSTTGPCGCWTGRYTHHLLLFVSFQ